MAIELCYDLRRTESWGESSQVDASIRKSRSGSNLA